MVFAAACASGPDWYVNQDLHTWIPGRATTNPPESSHRCMSKTIAHARRIEMPKVSTPDPIEFLLRSRFPSYRTINIPRSQSGGEISPDQRNQLRSEIESYRAELQAKSADEIRELVRRAKDREAKAIAARLAKEEQERFYNQPHAKADFSHYCKAATWTLDECVALSLGKEPLKVNWTNVKQLVQVSEFARSYERRRDLLIRAKNAGQLFDPVYPSIFLAWAKDKKIDLAEELVPSAVDHGISLKGWKELYEDLKERYSSDVDEMLKMHKKNTSDLIAIHKRDLGGVTEKLIAAERRLAEFSTADKGKTQTDPQATSERPLQTRERESLQLIAFLGAVRGYGYDPDGRTDAAARIENDTDTLSLRLSDDTVRNHLKRALDFIPPNWRELLNLKPNSDKA